MTETMSIRQMCDAYEVTPRALRFYEAKELLFPIRQGQKRLFTPRDRARMTLIQKGKRYGFALEEIRQLLDLYDREGEAAQMTEARKLAKKRLAELEVQRDELTSAIADLRRELEWGGQLADKAHAAE
jgi:DNA-binding transcriptional MerR regulator